ncbi:MAG: ankyrin repeat domain-containing protein [Planctomycetota bacterium]
MNRTTSQQDLPSSRMSKPYWLDGEELRRDGVVVDGDQAWEMFCACFDGDNGKVRELLTQDPNLINAQLWYCKPIDGALRYGHLDIVRTLLEFDTENTLAFYIDGDVYRCGKEEMRRRGHHHIVEFFEQEYWPRLSPNWQPEVDEIAAAFPSRWDKEKSVDVAELFARIDRDPKILHGQTRDGRSLLYLALEIRKLELAQQLVARGAALELRTAEGLNAIDIAALRCVDAIPFLLEHGLQQTLSGAIALGDLDTVRRQIEPDPDAMYRSRPFVPLTLAVVRNQREVVQLLLDVGTDPNHPTENCPWGNALLEAAERNNVELMRLLLEAGAFPTPGADSSGSVYDFLTHWGRRSAEEIAEAKSLLLKHGADPFELQVEEMDRLKLIQTASDEELLSPFWDGTFLTNCLEGSEAPELIDAYVARFGNERIIRGPFYEMCKAPESREVTEALMRHGYSVNQGDWLGRTALHAAAASNQLERATYLLELGANPNLLDAQHSATALGFAAREGHVEMVQLLLERGADKSLPLDENLAWARPLESAEHFLANHEYRFSGRSSNQGELTGRYTNSSKEQYEAVIELLS